MALVVVVMFLFLQNFRYTLIPAIVVPISLMGAVALMSPLGLSINVLTMFAMVLVIGIVVDDAIVVIENVERLMAEEKLTPYQATRKSMGQISSAIVGITLVNIVVFLPMAFFSGSTGNIYRQFALVMAGSIGFSGFLALTLTPALCATMLKPVRDDHHEKRGFFGWFNRLVKVATHAYEATIAKFIRISYAMFVVYLAVSAGAVYLYTRLPTSFLPNEDQATSSPACNCPPARPPNAPSTNSKKWKRSPKTSRKLTTLSPCKASASPARDKTWGWPSSSSKTGKSVPAPTRPPTPSPAN